MKEIKTVAIIGLGALGILFGNHLSKRMSGEHLRIIADERRIQMYRKNPVYANGERCSFQFVTPAEKREEPADLVLFMVKYNSLESAIRDARNQVGADTIIMSALNGITSEEIIGEVYGMDKVLYCVAQGMDGIKTGNKLDYKNMGKLCFGDREPGVISEKVQAVETFFKKTELPHEVATDMRKRLWGKLMLNVGVNQTIAVYEGNYGTVQRQGEPRETMIAAMREVIALSEKENMNLTEADLQYWLEVLASLSPEGQPSMRQDMVAKRPSEVELFSGTVVRMGEKYGIAVPVNERLYHQIKAIEMQF